MVSQVACFLSAIQASAQYLTPCLRALPPPPLVIHGNLLPPGTNTRRQVGGVTFLPSLFEVKLTNLWIWEFNILHPA